MKGNSFLYIPKYHEPLKDLPALDAVTAFPLDYESFRKLLQNRASVHGPPGVLMSQSKITNPGSCVLTRSPGDSDVCGPKFYLERPCEVNEVLGKTTVPSPGLHPKEIPRTNLPLQGSALS